MTLHSQIFQGRKGCVPFAPQIGSFFSSLATDTYTPAPFRNILAGPLSDESLIAI